MMTTDLLTQLLETKPAPNALGSWRVLLLVVLVCLGIALLAGFSARQTYLVKTEEVYAEADTMAGSTATLVATALAPLDRVGIRLVERIERTNDQTVAERLVEEARALLPRGVELALVASTASGSPSPVGDAAQSLLGFHRGHPEVDRHLTGPVRDGLVSASHTLALTRPIRDSSGAVQGVIAILIDRNWLAQLLNPLDLGLEDGAGIYMTSGVELARRGQPGSLDQLASSLVPAALDQGARGAESRPDPLTGDLRRESYHQVGDLPLLVDVSLSEPAALAPWRQQALFQFIGGAALFGLIGWLTLDLIRRSRRLVATAAGAEGAQRAYALLAQHSSDIIAVVDPTDRWLYVSPASAWVLGRQPSDLIGTAVASLIHPEDEQRIRERFRNPAITAGGRLQVTGRMRHADGHWVDLETQCTVVVDPRTGRRTLLIATLRDVSERVAIEARAAAAQRRVNAILEGTSEFVLGVNHDYQVTYLNPRLRQHLGLDEDPIPEDPPSLWTLLHDFADTSIGAAIRRAMTSGEPERLEEEPIGRRWYDFAARPTEDGLALFYRDVTARALGRIALQERDHRVEQILDGTELGTWHRDMRTGRLELSEHWLQLARYDASYKTLSMATFLALMVPEEDRDRVATASQAWHARETPILDLEHRLRRGDGSVIWIRARGAVLERDAQGEPVRTGGVMIDITAEHDLRQALERSNHDLDSARRAAEAANRSKTEFLAVMSHELRTPLNAILGFSELLKMGQLTDRQRRYVDLQFDAGKSLLAIITDILDISQLETGRIEIRPGEIDIVELVESGVALFNQAAEKANLALTTRIAPEVPRRMITDGRRLRQILTQLLSNAVKFTRAGSIAVSLAPKPGRPDLLQLCVRDTGIGIPPEMLDQLFQPFSQIDGSITRAYGGTGLGLAISRQLAELLGGTIEVETAVGVGSAFIVELPQRGEWAKPAGERPALPAVAPAARDSLPTPASPRPVEGIP